MNLDFDPLEFYKQELQSDQLHIKINTVHRLRLICTVLNTQQLESDLLPFLSSQIPEFEDEVLFALSYQLSYLHIYFPDSSLPLLPLLETLSLSDESLIRDSAISSLIELASYLPDYQIIHSFISTIFKLASSKSFQGKFAACKLVAAAYPRAGGFRDKLRAKLNEFCQDESVLIRKAAAQELLKLVDMIDKFQISNEIFHVVQKMMQDEEEEIRIILIEFVKKFIRVMGKEEVKAVVFPLILMFQEDQAWKVRLAFAKEFGEIVEGIDKEYLESAALQVVLKLLHDNENEVRVGIIKGVRKVLEKLSFEKITSLFVVIQAYVKEDSANLKTKIACLECLSEIWKVTELEFCMKSIFPTFEEIINEDQKEMKTVALKCLGRFSNLTEEIVNKKVKDLLRKSFGDKNWRIRKRVLKIITELTLSIGQEIFTQSLSLVFLEFLTDPVSEVRDSGCKELKKIISRIDSDWFSSVLCPKLQDMFLNTSWYLFKISILKVLSILPGDFIGIFNLASKDPIANVRLTVCKSIRLMVQEKKDCSLYLSMVYELKKDKDREVAYQASLINIESY